MMWIDSPREFLEAMLKSSKEFEKRQTSEKEKFTEKERQAFLSGFQAGFDYTTTKMGMQ